MAIMMLLVRRHDGAYYQVYVVNNVGIIDDLKRIIGNLERIIGC